MISISLPLAATYPEPLYLTLLVQETKIAESANNADPDEVAHNEPPSSRSILFAL